MQAGESGFSPGQSSRTLIRAISDARVSLAFVVVCAGVSLAADWPQWRGPRRDGTTAEEITLWPPVKLWETDVGMGVASLIAAAGRVYALGHRDGVDSLFCLDAQDGRTLWRHAYPAQEDQTSDVSLPGPRSTPATDGVAVYALSLEGRLVCLAAATGNVVWSKSPRETGASGKQQYGVCCPVLVHEDMVVCDVATQCVAFDKATGRELWRTAGGAGWNGAAPMVAHFGNRPCLIHGAGRCLDLATGRELWSVPYGEMSVTTAVVSGQRLFLTPFHGRNLGGRGCALIEVADGRPRVAWNNDDVEALCVTGVLHRGYLYVADRDDLRVSGESGRKMNLKCLEWETGRVLWTHRPLPWPTPIVAGDQLLVQTLDGELILADASPQGYRERGRMPAIPRRCWSIPAVADGKLFCRNNQGHVMCFAVRGK
jgi:outer membrane protein assembly factor BamB